MFLFCHWIFWAVFSPIFRVIVPKLTKNITVAEISSHIKLISPGNLSKCSVYWYCKTRVKRVVKVFQTSAAIHFSFSHCFQYVRLQIDKNEQKKFDCHNLFFEQACRETMTPKRRNRSMWLQTTDYSNATIKRKKIMVPRRWILKWRISSEHRSRLQCYGFSRTNTQHRRFLTTTSS